MAGNFSETGNFVARGPDKVNAALVDILQRAADAAGLKVQAYSGYRPGDPRQHGAGKATDVRIIGDDGKPLDNYQSPDTFAAYEKLAHAARQVQMDQYPDMDKQFRWGGYFSGGKGKYGALDLMHFDLGGSDKLGMAGGSWDKGLNPDQAKIWGLKPGFQGGDTALAFADGPKQNSAVGAVNALASGQPVPQGNALAQSAQYVPPPFANGKGFAPLFSTPQLQTTGPQGAPKAAPADKAQGGDEDILKSFLPAGADLSQTPGQGSQQATQSDEDILKAFLPKEAPAAGMQAAQAAAPAQSFGQKVGGAIDAATTTAEPYAQGANNVVRQVATGVPIIGGLLNKANAATNALIAPAINPMLSEGNQLKGDTWSERYANSLAEQNGMDTKFQSEHPVASTALQIGGGVASIGGLAARIPQVATALGATGNTLASRALAGAASGAVMGGADAAVRSEGDPTQTALGAGTGLLLGGGMPYAGKAIGATANKLIGGTIPQRVAELAQLASEKYGIKLGAGQLSSNPTIRFLDSVVNKIPFSGGTASKAAQQKAFNEAVANSFGESASEITPEVMSAARKRIGAVFDSVAERTPKIEGGNEFSSRIGSIMDDARQTIAESELGPLQKQVDNVLGKFAEGEGSISGETYQALTRKGAPLDRAMNSADPNIKYYAGQMRDALDEALQKSASPEVLADLKQARSHWKAMKTVEDLAEKSPTGDVSPSLLLGQVRKSYGSMAYGEGNDLTDLARIGQQFMKEPPSSGTAERTQVQNLLLGGAGGSGLVGMAVSPATIPYIVGPLAGAAVTGRAVGSVLRSPKLGNMLVQNTLNAGKDIPPTANKLMMRAVGHGIVPEANKLTNLR